MSSFAQSIYNPCEPAHVVRFILVCTSSSISNNNAFQCFALSYLEAEVILTVAQL